MPTYEYECSACGHRFEEFQSITAKPTVVCPKCKKRKVKRLISAGAGFIFKGSGFYITDYRSDKYNEAAKADTAAASPTVTPPATAGGDAKAPAAKTDAPAPATPAAPPAPAAPPSKPAAKSSSKKK